MLWKEKNGALHDTTDPASYWRCRRPPCQGPGEKDVNSCTVSSVVRTVHGVYCWMQTTFIYLCFHLCNFFCKTFHLVNSDITCSVLTLWPVHSPNQKSKWEVHVTCFQPFRSPSTHTFLFLSVSPGKPQHRNKCSSTRIQNPWTRQKMPLCGSEFCLREQPFVAAKCHGSSERY